MNENEVNVEYDMLLKTKHGSEVSIDRLSDGDWEIEIEDRYGEGARAFLTPAEAKWVSEKIREGGES